MSETEQAVRAFLGEFYDEPSAKKVMRYARRLESVPIEQLRPALQEIADEDPQWPPKPAGIKQRVAQIRRRRARLQREEEHAAELKAMEEVARRERPIVEALNARAQEIMARHASSYPSEWNWFARWMMATMEAYHELHVPPPNRTPDGMARLRRLAEQWQDVDAKAADWLAGYV